MSIRVTENTALILNIMIRDPRAWHAQQDLASMTGVEHQSVRNNLGKMFTEGWLAKKEDKRVRYQPRVYYRLTARGLTAARKELAAWTITENA